MDKFAYFTQYIGLGLSLIILYIIIILVFLPRLKSRILLKNINKIKNIKNYIWIEKQNFFKNKNLKITLLKKNLKINE